MAAPSARSQQVTGCQGGAAGAQLLSRLLGVLGKATPGFAPWVRHFCLYLSERSKNPCSYAGDDPTSNDPRVFVDVVDGAEEDCAEQWQVFAAAVGR